MLINWHFWLKTAFIISFLFPFFSFWLYAKTVMETCLEGESTFLLRQLCRLPGKQEMVRLCHWLYLILLLLGFKGGTGFSVRGTHWVRLLRAGLLSLTHIKQYWCCFLLSVCILPAIRHWKWAWQRTEKRSQALATITRKQTSSKLSVRKIIHLQGCWKICWCGEHSYL
jgi:hypothetical protein